MSPKPALKGPLALRTISEAAEQLGVEQHVLRFWETKFPFIRPTKRAGGRRFYRPQDLALLQGVKALLYDRGLTIRGVQILFKDKGQKAILSASDLSDSELGALVNLADDGSDDADMLSVEPESVETDGVSAGKMTPETRQRFLEIARMLEDAQIALGKTIGRHR